MTEIVAEIGPAIAHVTEMTDVTVVVTAVETVVETAVDTIVIGGNRTPAEMTSGVTSGTRTRPTTMTRTRA